METGEGCTKMSKIENREAVIKEFSEKQLLILLAYLEGCVTKKVFAEGVCYVRNSCKEFA
jgi:hypothetical protein